MENNYQLSPPEILKRFDFLNGEEPPERKWVECYLNHKHIPVPRNPPNMQSLKFALLQHIQTNALSNSEIKNLAQAMSSAWRVRKSRLKKNAGTLSLTLDNSVLKRFKQMCNGEKKAEILTLLINGGYEEFLASEQALKFKKEEESRIKQELKFKIKEEESQIKQMAIADKKLDLLLKKPPTAVKDSQAIQELQAKNDDLKQRIATLYDLIYSANERGKPIDDALLIEATKVYYSAFLKTNNDQL